MTIHSIRIAFFGCYYPSVTRLGPTSTGIVFLLSQEKSIGKIDIYAQSGSILVPSERTGKTLLHPCWSFNSPTSLFRAGLDLVRARSTTDVYFFNLYMTLFGRSRTVNALGLMLPVLVRALSRKRVIVYMHNFVETQSLSELGYRPSPLTRRIARTIELLVLRFTQVLVPLQSQKKAIQQKLGVEVSTLFIPHVEAIWTMSKDREARKSKSDTAPMRILLFGSWGPQKDIFRVLDALGPLVASRLNARVTVAGSINVNFPGFRELLLERFRSLDERWFRVELNVPNTRADELLSGADVLILPYNAAGGYSAVMNLGSAYRIPMIAYDIPELREQAMILNADCSFIPPGDSSALERAISSTCTGAQTKSRSGTFSTEDTVPSLTRQSVNELLRHLRSP